MQPDGRGVDPGRRTFQALTPMHFFLTTAATKVERDLRARSERVRRPRSTIASSAILLAGMVCIAPLAAPATTVRTEEESYVRHTEQWRRERAAKLQHPTSWLALIGRHPLPPGEHTLGSVEGSGIRLAAGPGRLGTITHAADGRVMLALTDGVDAKIDGTDARTAELIHTGGEPTYVRFGTVNFYVMKRGDELFLRARDTESPRRKHFAGLAWYPVDAAWRIEADWLPFSTARTVPITNVLGQTSQEPVPGQAVFTLAGRTHELLP
ncbi:MAG: DUF1684 domain-containing protein, partial [Gemmatimonadetes bacterium]|nr:DUF1684 domain-containing protein [Gemmatimonadota bacterium]